MNWIKFRDRYLFSINFSIMVGAILFAVRKDWLWHPAILVLLVLSVTIPSVENAEKKLLHFFGKINSFVLLTTFYFLFFTPFSFIYRAFFRNKSFSRDAAGFTEKTSISPFDRPF